MSNESERIDSLNARFIDEPITPLFDSPPVLEKKPPCPDGFVWQGESFRVVEMLSEWHDYARRGKMGANMRPEHAATASRRGSWGVGRDNFRVRVAEGGRVFDLYYDRAPKGMKQKKGSWMLFREIL